MIPLLPLFPFPPPALLRPGLGAVLEDSPQLAPEPGHAGLGDHPVCYHEHLRW